MWGRAVHHPLTAARQAIRKLVFQQLQEERRSEMEEREMITPNHRRVGNSSAVVNLDVDSINPFVFNPPFTICDKLIIFFNAFWLLPLRLFLFVIPAVTAGLILLFLGGLGERYDPDNPTPLPRWRKRTADKVSNMIDRVFLFGFGYQWIHHKGAPADAKVAPITVAVPHSSMLDIFAVLRLHGVPTFVAQESIRNLFVFGPLIAKTMRTIFVKRDDHDSRVSAAEEIRRRAESGGEWPRVLVFPEGTTHNRKVLLQFKKGAFQPGVPIQPCLIKYQNRLGTATWCGPGINQLKGLFYTLCQFHNSLEVEYLDVYTPSQEEIDDADLYSRNVQQLIAKELGVPPGMQSLEDNFIMAYGCHLGLPFSSSMVVFGKVQQDMGLRAREVKDYLTRFAKINRAKDGHLTLGDLAEFLGVPVDSELRDIFDGGSSEDKELQMSFRKYLYTFVGPSRTMLEDEDFLRSAFHMFDSNNDGLVNSEDFTSVLSVRKLAEEVQPSLKPESKNRTRRRRKNEGQRSEGQQCSVPSTVATGVELEEENVTFTYDQFKAYLKSNPEYLLLFQSMHKRRSSPTEDIPSQTNSTRIKIEVKEE